MHFGYPVFLWGLLAVPLPILLHLFFRRRKARVAFSTLQFFLPQKRDLARRRRLREILLLLLRTLAVLGLVLALAKATLQKLPAAFAARTDIAILLDDTLSMDRKLGSGMTAFAFAVQKADELLNTLSEGDAAALVFLSGRPGIALTRKRQTVRHMLENARVTGASGSFSAALQQAQTDLSTGGTPNREIFVLSDFQLNQMPAKPIALDAAKGMRIYLLPLLGSQENLSVSSLSLSSRPKTVNKPLTIPYEITNHGENTRETEVTLTVGADDVRSESIAVPAGETAKGHFEYVPLGAGVLNGAVRINDPLLSLDNRRFFTLNVSESIHALLVESDILSRIRSLYFLRLALDPSSGAAVNGILTEQGFIQELTARQLAKHHVVVFANPQPFSAQTAALLTRYMQDGGTVLVFAGGDVDGATCAAFPMPALRALFGARGREEHSGVTFKNALAGLNDLLQLELVKWQRLHALTPSPAATVLAECGGQPLIVDEPVGSGRFIACAFSVRRDTGNWPELKSFPIAMIHLMTYAAHDVQQNASMACGRILRLSALSADDATIPLSHSAGTRAELPVANGEALFSDTWQPGILTAERATPRSVAVNPVPDESVLTPAGPAKLGNLINSKATVLKTDAALDTQIRNTRRGSDLTGLFLLLVVAVLLLETFLGNRYRPHRKT